MRKLVIILSLFFSSFNAYSQCEDELSQYVQMWEDSVVNFFNSPHFNYVEVDDSEGRFEWDTTIFGPRWCPSINHFKVVKHDSIFMALGPGWYFWSLRVRFYFDHNEDELKGKELERFNDFAATIKDHHYPLYTVNGYADTVGREGYNDTLALKRANYIKQRLVYWADRQSNDTGKYAKFVDQHFRVFAYGEKCYEYVKSNNKEESKRYVELIFWNKSPWICGNRSECSSKKVVKLTDKVTLYAPWCLEILEQYCNDDSLCWDVDYIEDTAIYDGDNKLPAFTFKMCLKHCYTSFSDRRYESIVTDFVNWKRAEIRKELTEEEYNYYKKNESRIWLRFSTDDTAILMSEADSFFILKNDSLGYGLSLLLPGSVCEYVSLYGCCEKYECDDDRLNIIKAKGGLKLKEVRAIRYDGAYTDTLSYSISENGKKAWGESSCKICDVPADCAIGGRRYYVLYISAVDNNGNEYVYEGVLRKSRKQIRREKETPIGQNSCYYPRVKLLGITFWTGKQYKPSIWKITKKDFRKAN